MDSYLEGSESLYTQGEAVNLHPLKKGKKPKQAFIAPLAPNLSKIPIVVSL